MQNNDTDLLYPQRATPYLRDLRSEAWQELIDHVIEEEATSLDRLAFELMMIRLGGCTSCQSDSFRAMRGCIQCAIQTIRRYRGEDQDLIKLFNDARRDVGKYLEKV